MTDLSIASVIRSEAIAEIDDHSSKTVVLFSCIGLMASLCLTAFGVDLGAGWMI